MKILALEAYYGGSHRAFLDGWVKRSGHEWTVLTLEAYKWKWRMRHSAVTFAERVTELSAKGERWDVLFCSDMVNLAEFAGLVGGGVRDLPRVAYFHENQLTYPVRFESERDYQFAMTNMTTCLAADAVWFNSEFNRQSFLDALGVFLKRMPDNQPFGAIEKIRRKSQTQSPGVEAGRMRGARKSGPMRILWAGRWEHDKNFEEFYEAICVLRRRGGEFRLNVVGESFRDTPEVFELARREFGENIDRWGFQQSQSDYYESMAESDVVVSTARHEFFGIGVIEAIEAGCYPVLPKRLAYPEVMGLGENAEAEKYFYDGSVGGLVGRLAELAGKFGGAEFGEERGYAVRVIEKYRWERRVRELDEAIALAAVK